MKKKLTFIVVPLIVLLAIAVYAGEERGQRNPTTAAAAGLTSEREVRSSATSTPLSGTPIEIQTGPVNRTRDECDLTGTAVYYIQDWFYGMEWHANYQDPEEFGCADVWPFQVAEVIFEIQVDSPIDIEVQGFVFDNASPPCPIPGNELCATPVYTVSLPGAGYYRIPLPLAEECCVYEPYFAVIYIYTDLVGSGADAISGDDGLACRSYNNISGYWQDLVNVYSWPGQMMLYSTGSTSPQNDCPDTSVQGCCQILTGYCLGPMDKPSCDQIGGLWLPPPAVCVPFGVYSYCQEPKPNTTIVEPNDTSRWDKNYFSDTLTIQAVDSRPVSDVVFTEFEYFDGYGWSPIDVDLDGTTYMQDPTDTLQPTGDGWQAKWYPPGSLLEGYYMIRATMYGDSGSTSDTIVQYYDPYPPEAIIIEPPVFNYPVDPSVGPVDILFSTPGDNLTEMYITVYPVRDYPGRNEALLSAEPFDCIQGFNKGVPHFDQHDLYPDGTDGKNRGCSPTSMAACLKYWVENGYPCLNDSGSMTDSQMVAEIAIYAGTNPNSGTGMKKKKPAIEKYIKEHCGECKFQPVKHLQGDAVTLKRLIKELYEEEEDVITGDYHHVTVVNSFCLHPKKFIDYMDPWTGTEVNGEFDVSKGFDGHPLLELVIVSPKEPVTTTPPPDTIAYPDDITPVEPGTYHYPWYPNPELFPVGRAYVVNVELTDAMGHKGWDLVKIELFIRGDATGDGIINVGDVVFLVNYLYRGDIPPFPADAGDANCDGVVNVGDVVYLVNYLYRDGDPPGCP